MNMNINLSQIKTHFSSVLLAVILCLFSQGALAGFKCTNTYTNNMQNFIVPSLVKIPTANLAPDSLVWMSQTVALVVTCAGSEPDIFKRGIFINFDPKGDIASIDPSLKVVVAINGNDQQVFQNNAYHTGTQLACQWQGGLQCNSVSFSFNYIIFIKSTGKNPPASGNITSNGTYTLFSIGEKNDNSTDGSNAYVNLSGLNNIKFVSCQPQINVVANNGAAVDFGSVQAHNAQVGKTEKQIPFSVQANLTNAGQDCQGKAMNVSFSTTNPTSGNDTILPSADSGFGFSVSPANAQNSFIPLNTNVSLGYVNGSVAKNDFVASLRWLNNTPKTGTFRASANVDVTFK